MLNSRINICVIVRTCGRSAVFLERALASIKAQTFQPTQIVVSNDGAEGRIVEEVVRLARLALPRVLVIQRDGSLLQNRSAALNRALVAAETPWVSFLDDDDTWVPDFLGKMAEVVGREQGTEKFGGVVCQTEAVYERFKDEQLTELGREPFNPHLHRLDASTLARSNRFTINAAIWRKAVFSKTGMFREDLAVLEDWEFNVRAAQDFRLEILPQYLARYHRRLGGGLAANSSLKEHDRMMDVLQAEWRRIGLIASDESRVQRLISSFFFRFRRQCGRFRFWFRWWRRL